MENERTVAILDRKVQVNAEGHLMLGGVDAVELAAQYGTPLYVMEEDTIRRAMQDYVRSMTEFYDGRGLVCYASKAFACKELFRMAQAEGLGVDVVSGGELLTAMSVGFPAEKICFHGNNKSLQELRMAVDYGVGRIVVDNLTELARLDRLAGEMGKTASILLRITPGVDAHTHDFIRTGQIDSKFGITLENGDAMQSVKAALAAAHISLRGLHCHIGSQILDAEPFVHTAEIMIDFLAQIRAETGETLSDLNLGGGFGIRYTNADDPIPYRDYMQAVSAKIAEKTAAFGLPQPFVLIEPGRSIVGEAGTTLYTVGGRKEIPGVRTYLSIDGGMFEDPRYALYGSKYDMLLANKVDMPANETVTVAGKCCESGDLIGEQVPLAHAEPGDLLAVLSTGAYNYSMASNYNRNPIPAVVMVRDGQSRVIVRGQTYEDLIQYDV